ncbi:probable 1-deoxy-D-xylulose-5-phosphate synthase, chloroplastic isoform X1 [Amborella trichopoda]|nr:probable 1-deoxy-D-xylulose-5-phosphate synthase, chloroplastic isoform X1 [Amborella trichopoda]|eukprot:XP_020529570.1 probable 1-deoxy-D-xylulose-5-phosphate synthase, chloroplastic isoform X1 [Amborella trichopoda]
MGSVPMQNPTVTTTSNINQNWEDFDFRFSCFRVSKPRPQGFLIKSNICQFAPYPSSLKRKRRMKVLILSQVSRSRICAIPDIDDFYWEKAPTPLLDMVETPIHLKNLSLKDLKRLADEIRAEITFVLSKTCRHFKPSLGVVELTIAIHYVFHAPMDKILWDVGEQTYAHKILTGRRPRLHTLRQKNGLSGFTSRFESEYDPFGAAHGCNSVSAGLGMAAARDLKGKKDRIVTVISNWTTMAGQIYEAMSNAGYLDPNMVVILNDSRHSLQMKPEEGSKMAINALSSTLSKIQSSRSFRKFREAAKGVTKRIGRGMHEIAAKVDEYARGMMGPLGSTLFEELGLYYIGPVAGHNIDDLICVLQEVASLESTGPVLVHVITEEECESKDSKKNEIVSKQPEPRNLSTLINHPVVLGNGFSRTYMDFFVDALLVEAERDKNIVVVHAGMGMDPAFSHFQARFQDRFFDVGLAEQHAVTFSAGLSCAGMKPFCVIPSSLLQRAYDQVVQDVDMQRMPVRFVITSAGLVGSDGPTYCGAFDITMMSCLPNMIVMAPSNEADLIHMIATAAAVNDCPICFRYPRRHVFGADLPAGSHGVPIEIGRGSVIAEGKDLALLGYGVMVQNCLKARTLLLDLGIVATVADARFCKPLDMDLVRHLCQAHPLLITVEEGSIGGFASHVAQFIALDGLLDNGNFKWRPIVLPDNYIEHASPKEQLSMAGLTAHHIAATALSLLGRTRDALQLMH